MSAAEPREPREPRAQLRGTLVEGVRLIFIALFATGGYTIGLRANAEAGAARTILYVFLGAALGYVMGGVFGRLTIRAVSGMEEELRRRQPAELAGGIVGLVIGLVIAALLMLPLLFLPPLAGWPAILFIYLSFGSLGFRLGQSRYEDIFGMIGMKPRASATGRGDIHVIDTSALIDGRVADLVNTGFISGTLLLHDGVLRELQAIADSSDHRRRARGRRGLDVLVELQKSPTVQIQLVEELGVQDVDAALVRLAKERGGTLVTVDHNLARVAEALRVPVAQINSLATKFRTPFTAGDELTVHLVKEGREHGQGVGYLDDGTMVVVESANPHIGSDVTVRVKNVIQTTTGRMIFSSLPAADAEAGSEV
ncbi:MAG: TRAM domain-containing protein [Actinomycetota bacterium]